MKMGCAGPPLEPFRRPQAGKSRDPYSQNADRSAVLRQEVEGLRKSLEHSDAYFLVQQQALEDFSAKHDKANKLAKLIANMVDTQHNVS